MLKRKNGNNYIPANTIDIVHTNIPLKVNISNSNGLMKVINGVWAVTSMFVLMIIGNKLVCESNTITVNNNILTLPDDANVSVSGNTLIRS